MTKLTPAQLDVSRAWLHDIFVWGGIAPTPKRDFGGSVYHNMYGRAKYDSTGTDYAKKICNFIKFRQVKYQDFLDIDKALEYMSGEWFNPNLHSERAWESVRKKPDMLARYIGNFLAEQKLYFDDSYASPYEMEEIKKTMIGTVLWDYQCFTSQEPVVKQRAASTGSSTPRTPGQPPQNNYKQSGPQSGNVRALVGQPGQKVVAQGNISFRIEGTNANSQKVPATVHVKPLSKKGDANGVNKVFIGSANGYTDCACYFDDLNDANNFLQKCLAICPPNVSNLHIVKVRSDANGYFLVNTEFGQCAIVASKLNEELKEEVENITEEYPSFMLDDSNIDAYTEAFFKYE